MVNTEARLNRIRKKLDEGEVLRDAIYAQRGVSPGIIAPFIHAFNTIIVVAVTDKNIVVISCWAYTPFPFRVRARLPRNTIIGPVDHTKRWSRIHVSIRKDGGVGRATWVGRSTYRLVDAADAAASPKKASPTA